MATNTRNQQTPVTDAIAIDILIALRRILRKTAEHSRTIAKKTGLTVPQVLCLRAIAEGEATGVAITVAKVAESVQLSMATVSRLLDRLVESRLVSRKRDTADRRKVLLTLTKLGHRKLVQAPAPLHEAFLAKLDQLSERQRRDLLASLQKVVAMMGADTLDASPLLTSDAEVKLP